MQTNRLPTASALSDQLRRPDEDNLPAQAVPHKAGLLRKSVDALNDAVNSLKKQDMTELVETFTAEMTLVAEGLSEDQAQLSQQAAELSAQHTIYEETLRSHMDETNKTLQDLRKRVEVLENKTEKTARRRGSLTQALKQATWIAAILGTAWVITTLLKTFGG